MTAEATEILKWPYPTIVDDWRAETPQWREINEETYEWFLGCVPTIRGGWNKYMNSEAYTHNDHGEGVYLAAKMEGDKFYARLATTQEWDSGQI